MAYIVFEGGEGSGKSTQVGLLADKLPDAVVTREPGGTPLGVKLRALLLESDDAICPESEAYLMAADRAQHITTVVRPALQTGRHVVSDRSFYSSMAYQGAGRNLGSAEIAALNAMAVGDTVPDIVVLLDVDRHVASARLDRCLDRLERMGETFHTEVRNHFRTLAASDSERWAVVDGCGAVDEVAERIWAAVSARLGEKKGPTC